MSIASELIDVRAVPPAHRHPLILGAFDALANGEGFSLVSDHDPVPLQRQFEQTRAGQYLWCALESGPRRWHVRIERVALGPVTRTPGQGCACACRGS